MKDITIKQFTKAIRALPPDKCRIYPGKWYTCQKEHWLGWLAEYDGPGAYDRKGGKNRNAKFAYNHIVEYRMLLWLVDAAGIPRSLVKTARGASAKPGTMQRKAAAVRKVVPWDLVAAALWG